MFCLTPNESNKLLDALKAHVGCKNDAALARYMEVAPPVLSKIRHRKEVAGNALLLNALVRTGMTYAELARWWA